MESDRDRKRKADSDEEIQGRVRKSAKVSGECCPVCQVTLWPETVHKHYQQELDKLSVGLSGSTSLSKRRSSHSGSSRERKIEERTKNLITSSAKLLESVQRRRIIFQHRPSPPCPASSAPGPSDSSPTCPVCATPLSSDQAEATAHVNECLGGEVGVANDDDDEEYEEYTWCDVTHVRTTSMMSAQERANILGATVLSRDEAGSEELVDVEKDETADCGPPQFNETGSCLGSQDTDTVEEDKLDRQSLKCLICMDEYTRPLVSVQCWHVYCEVCWLQALKAKKVCPKCKQITSHSHLRKIFL